MWGSVPGHHHGQSPGAVAEGVAGRRDSLMQANTLVSLPPSAPLSEAVAAMAGPRKARQLAPSMRSSSSEQRRTTGALACSDVS